MHAAQQARKGGYEWVPPGLNQTRPGPPLAEHIVLMLIRKRASSQQLWPGGSGGVGVNFQNLESTFNFTAGWRHELAPWRNHTSLPAHAHWSPPGVHSGLTCRLRCLVLSHYDQPKYHVIASRCGIYSWYHCLLLCVICNWSPMIIWYMGQ